MKSLERQLLTSLTIVLTLILAGQLLIANISTRNTLSKFVTSKLEHDAKRLFDSLIINQKMKKVHWRRINPVYNTPNSGHYYTIQLIQQGSPNTLLTSPSLQESSLPIVKSNFPKTTHNISGPLEQHLIVWTQKYNKNGYDVIISVAEDMSQLMKRTRRFSLIFIAISIIGFILLLALQRIVIRRLFKHLDHSRNEIKEIETGKRQSLSENVPREIYPLVKEFNYSLSLMQKRLERSRNSLGNLAHALKTPLSILIQNLEKDKRQNNKQTKLQAERIRQLMERELKRARMAGLGNSTERFEPEKELEVLSTVLKQAHKRPDLDINFIINEKVTSFGDREDMLELFGNLLDNACKWAKVQVLCNIHISNKNRLNISIEDDGTGQAPDELSKLTNRGERIDELTDGHGLGLSICKDIIKLYGGTMSFHRSPILGGLQVKINLPLS